MLRQLEELKGSLPFCLRTDTWANYAATTVQSVLRGIFPYSLKNLKNRIGYTATYRHAQGAARGGSVQRSASESKSFFGGCTETVSVLPLTELTIFLHTSTRNSYEWTAACNNVRTHGGGGSVKFHAKNYPLIKSNMRH